MATSRSSEGSRRVAGTTRWNAQSPAAALALIASISPGAPSVSLATTRTRCMPNPAVPLSTDSPGHEIYG